MGEEAGEEKGEEETGEEETEKEETGKMARKKTGMYLLVRNPLLPWIHSVPPAPPAPPVPLEGIRVYGKG
jgi:hypothetical protein